MQDKTSLWTYITSLIVLIACALWALYEYRQAPTKFPFEPMIAVLTYLFALFGYLKWKPGRNITPTQDDKMGDKKGDSIQGDNSYIIKGIKNSKIEIKK
jgi:hypothetical protein